MELCNDQGLNSAINKVAADMRAIHDEFARVTMIAGSDLRKRKVKELVASQASASSPKEPYATEEELARTRELASQLRSSSHAFLEACHELVTMRDTFGLRQAKRTALKRPVRHCRHCAGRRAVCGCSDECARANPSIKCFLHCRHCVGDEEECKCTHGCPNASRRTKCEKKTAPPTATSA